MTLHAGLADFCPEGLAIVRLQMNPVFVLHLESAPRLGVIGPSQDPFSQVRSTFS